jgi:hypothetical protein
MRQEKNSSEFFDLRAVIRPRDDEYYISSEMRQEKNSSEFFDLRAVIRPREEEFHISSHLRQEKSQRPFIFPGVRPGCEDRRKPPFPVPGS